MNVQKPIEVVVPNYNHAQYLRERLVSLDRQTQPAKRIHLLDDASTDLSLEILRQYSDDHGVALICNDRNSGSPFKQWNKGVGLCDGEYVWIAESDDVAEPDFLESLVKVLDEHPQVGIAYCASMIINAEGREQGSYVTRLDSMDESLWHRDFVMSGKEMLRHYQVAMNCVPSASSVVFRRSVYEAAGGAPEDMRSTGDWMTWSRMMLHGDVAYVAKHLNRWRSHGGSVTSGSFGTQRYVLEYASVIRFISDSVDVPSASRKKALDKLFARWRLCTRGISPNGVLQLFRHVDSIGGARSAGRFLVRGIRGLMSSIARGSGLDHRNDR